MLKSDLLEAEKEAKRFLEKVKIAKRMESFGWNNNSIEYGATSAAIKRSSLDLSKSLAKIRKSDY